MKPVAIFVWAYFGPYHVDRLEAAARALADDYQVVGVEVAGSNVTYAWEPTQDIAGVERITLFPNTNYEKIPTWPRFVALVKTCLRKRPRHVFLCQFNRREIFFLAMLLRLAGRRVHLMIESKFDDKPRLIWREALKAIICLPYNRALVGGARTRDYLRLLGFRPTRVEFGYDTVSMARIQQLAGAPPAPQGKSFRERHFTIVARLVPKKNIAMALDAFAQYCRTAGSEARELHICGSGELEAALRRKAQELGLTRVVFRGFLQAPEIARALASSLALILPSTEEQWGLVINEALAMGVPILCSDNVGARDLLVRTAVNGFAFEPDNPEGLARLMQRLAADESEWRRLAEGSLSLSPLADTQHFGAGVARLVGLQRDGLPVLERQSVIDASS
jgi:glycosyltransferase involved in cell wall biosynthesis